MIATSLIFLPTLLFITLAPSFRVAVAAFYLFGGLTGAMDVSMNANAVEVEKAMGRAIMSSCHAFWSLGGFLGSSMGGYLVEHFGAVPHATLVTVLCAIILFCSYPAIMPDGPHLAEASSGGKSRSRLPLTPLPWLIGIMALFSMIQEGIVIDWSGLYLKTHFAASLSVAALGAGAGLRRVDPFIRVSLDLLDRRSHVRYEADPIGRVVALERPDRITFRLLVLGGAGRLVALKALVAHLRGYDLGRRSVGPSAVLRK